MLEKMFIYQEGPGVYGTIKQKECFAENQWHFSTTFPFQLVMQWCLKKKKRSFLLS